MLETYINTVKEFFVHCFVHFIMVYVIGVHQAIAVRCGNVSILFPYVTYFELLASSKDITVYRIIG